MTYPLIPQPSTPLKQRLLTGASAAVIVLAMSVAAPSGAMAQEIDGDATDATVITNGGVVINDNDVTGNDFGAIDTDIDSAAGVDPASISLANDATITITDSDAANTDTSTVAGAFVIETGVTGTLIFAQSDDNGTNATDGNDAILTIAGDLEGAADTRGGTLNVLVRDGINQEESAFNVNGSTNMAAITIGAGNADAAANGGNIAATFGSGDDTFDSTGLTVNGGNANAGNSGGDATVTIAADGDTGVVTIGATGIQVNGGDAADAGNGGAASLTIADSATIAGAVTVQGGDEGTGNGNGNTATLDFTDVSGTVTIEGALTIATGTDTAGVAGTGGNATAIFASTTVNANGGVVLSEQQNATATLTLDGTADQTFNGAITVANDGDGELFVNNAAAGQQIVFSGTIGTDANRIATIDLDNDDTFTFQNNVFANTLEVVAGSAVFQGANSVLEGIAAQGGDFAVGGGTSASTLTVEGDVANTGASLIGDMGTLVLSTVNGAVDVTPVLNADAAASTTTIQTVDNDGDADNDANAVTFFGAVGTTQPIDTFTLGDDTNFNGDVAGGSLSAADGVDVVLNEDGTFTGDITGDGSLVIGAGGTDDILTIGADGATSTVSIANLDGAAGNAGNIDITNGALVTIETTIGDGGVITNFTSDGADTVLTINSGDKTTPSTSVTGEGVLTLDNGTIVLGRNIGAGDTVFDFDPTGTFEVSNNVTTTVQLSANFLANTLTFVDSSADESTEIDGNTANGELVVTDTALTDFELATVSDTAADDNITITANARTAADTATLLGVSVEDATALRQAVISTDGANDDEGLDALTAALNTGGTGSTLAAQAARTVGTQEDTLGGASNTAFAAFGDVFTLIANSGGGFGGTFIYPDNGFSGGDLIVSTPPASFTAAPAPTRSGSVWGRAFGGVANADGDTNFAGYDSAYGGGIIGVDGAISEDFTIGAFGTYFMSNVDGDGAGNSEIDAHTFGFGVYADYTTQDFYLDAFAAYGMSNNDLTRTAVVNNVTRTITADYDATQFALGVAGGVPMEVSPNVFITPNASLTYNHYDANTYTETGGGGFSQVVNPAAVSQVTGTIGARIHAVYADFDNDGTVFIPELRVALIGDLMDDDATATALFTGAGATAYQVTGTDTDDVGALIGVGLGFDNPDWSASLNYDADLRSDFMSHTARAEFRWKF